MPIPKDGNYYIYTVGYKRVWDSAELKYNQGNPILGFGLDVGGVNQEWTLKAQTASGPQTVSIQCVGAQGNGAFACNDNFVLADSPTSFNWFLENVEQMPNQFRIRTADQYGHLVVTLRDGTAGVSNFRDAQLTLDSPTYGATNQIWMFIPVDDMPDFAKTNGLPV